MTSAGCVGGTGVKEGRKAWCNSGEGRKERRKIADKYPSAWVQEFVASCILCRGSQLALNFKAEGTSLRHALV